MALRLNTSDFMLYIACSVFGCNRKNSKRWCALGWTRWLCRLQALVVCLGLDYISMIY